MSSGGGTSALEAVLIVLGCILGLVLIIMAIAYAKKMHAVILIQFSRNFRNFSKFFLRFMFDRIDHIPIQLV